MGAVDEWNEDFLVVDIIGRFYMSILEFEDYEETDDMLEARRLGQTFNEIPVEYLADKLLLSLYEKAVDDSITDLYIAIEGKCGIDATPEQIERYTIELKQGRDARAAVEKAIKNVGLMHDNTYYRA